MREASGDKCTLSDFHLFDLPVARTRGLIWRTLVVLHRLTPVSIGDLDDRNRAFTRGDGEGNARPLRTPKSVSLMAPKKSVHCAVLIQLNWLSIISKRLIPQAP